MKLRKLHIDNYKMFKDFDISFVDENDEALPIIVLAGVNGSGKTTLLEFVNECIYYNSDEVKNYIESQISENDDFIKIAHDYSHYGLTAIYKDNCKHAMIRYFPFNENIITFKELLPKYIENMIFVDGIAPFDSYKKVTQYMNEILKDLDVKIEFDSRDGEGNLFFRNKSGGGKFSIDELSTGEKTLLSKVLFLYLEGITDKVILIDEPELSLHPSWQNKVLKIYENFAKQNNCQIIIATHSPHIIGSAKPEYIRVLKKVDDKIEVFEYDKSYGLEFNKILTDIMGAETRVSDVSERLSTIKKLIINNDFESEEFKSIWHKLEDLIGADNIDLRLLKLEIASRKKNVQNK